MTFDGRVIGVIVKNSSATYSNSQNGLQLSFIPFALASECMQIPCMQSVSVFSELVSRSQSVGHRLITHKYAQRSAKQVGNSRRQNQLLSNMPACVPTEQFQPTSDFALASMYVLASG